MKLLEYLMTLLEYLFAAVALFICALLTGTAVIKLINLFAA